MATTAQQLIEAAYLRSTANAPGKLASTAELIGQLERVHQAYCALLAVAAPERWVTSSTLNWLGNPAVIGLGATDLIDILRLETSSGKEITLGPVAEKGRAWFTGVPFVWRQGSQLFSRGTAIDPQAGDSSQMFYLDAPANITALNSTIDARFPVRFEMLLILDLAIYLSLKDPEAERQAEADQLKIERGALYTAFEALNGIVHTATQTPWPGRNRPAAAAPAMPEKG